MGRDRNKGGVGNFFTIPRSERTAIRRRAREFAAHLVADYASKQPQPDHDWEHLEFLAELERIAARLNLNKHA